MFLYCTSVRSPQFHENLLSLFFLIRSPVFYDHRFGPIACPAVFRFSATRQHAHVLKFAPLANACYFKIRAIVTYDTFLAMQMSKSFKNKPNLYCIYAYSISTLLKFSQTNSKN